MHDTHKGHHSSALGHHHDHADEEGETLRKIQIIIEHWIEHGDSHAEQYREWATKAHNAREDEVAKEIYLAIQETESARNHLKRARDIVAAKLVLRK